MNSGSIKRMTLGLPFVVLAAMLLLHHYPLGPTVKPSPTASVTATPIRTASATATPGSKGIQGGGDGGAPGQAGKAGGVWPPCPVIKGFKVNQIFTIKGYEAQTLLDRHGCPAILVIMPLKANGDVQANK